MTWETRRLIRKMYVYEYKSIPAIAKELKCAKEGIRRALHLMDVELRTKTSTRICKIPGCGGDCFKFRDHNGRSYVLKGTLCEKHTREMWHFKNLARRFKAMYSKTQEHEVRETEIHKPAGFAFE
jgi:hypothetical protein